MAYDGLVGCATLFFGSLVSWHFENDEGFIDAIRADVNKLAGDDDGNADDTSSIDNIVNAYYEVVSGPEGFIYDADRDANIHADGALITKVFPDGRFQRHDLSTEQAMISVPYDQAFFESEVDRRIERYRNIACVE